MDRILPGDILISTKLSLCSISTHRHGWSPAMPLPRTLANVLLTHRCPRCGHEHAKKGIWFQTITHYRCESCRLEMRMTYLAKIKLFEAHARRTNRPG